MASVAAILRGTLKGMGRGALCEVMANRHTTAAGTSQFSDIRFLNPPRDFPDGDYVITVECRTYSARRRDGEWLIGNELLAEHRISARAKRPS